MGREACDDKRETTREKEIKFYWPRSTMDSIRVSEAPDTGSIPVEATSL